MRHYDKKAHCQLFTDPVNQNEFTNYKDVVERPLDLRALGYAPLSRLS